MDDEVKKMLIQIMEGQEALKLEIKKNTESIVGLENKMMERTEALFDGYKTNIEKILVVSEKVDDLRLDINNISIKTLKSENKIIELDRKMAR